MAYCTNCGQEVPEGTKFCSNCGAPIDDHEAIKNAVKRTEPYKDAGSYIGNDSGNNEFKKKTTGPVWGIVAFVLALIGIVMKSPMCEILLIASIVLAIVSFVKKGSLKGFAIAAIIVSVVGLIGAANTHEKEQLTVKEDLSIESVQQPIAENAEGKAEAETKAEGEDKDEVKAKDEVKDKAVAKDKDKDKAEIQDKDEVENKSNGDAASEDTDSKGAASEDDVDAKNVNVPDGVDPDLAAFLSEYEQFMDKYVVFMQKYKKNPTDLSLLGDYAEMMQEYSDFSKKADAYKTDSMSAADASYYLEVTTRVSQKMLKVLGS